MAFSNHCYFARLVVKFLHTYVHLLASYSYFLAVEVMELYSCGNGELASCGNGELATNIITPPTFKAYNTGMRWV